MTNNWKIFDLPNAEVKVIENFFDSSLYFKALLEDTPWRQDKITVYGVEYDVPRLQQWFGDSDKTYVYSGIKMKPLAWTKILYEIKKLVEEACEQEFNSVLLNHYRDGNDTVGVLHCTMGDLNPRSKEYASKEEIKFDPEKQAYVVHDDYYSKQPSLKYVPTGGAMCKVYHVE